MSAAAADNLKLEVLAAEHAVCRAAPSTDPPQPPAPRPSSVWSLTVTDLEMSLVCERTLVPAGFTSELGWRVLRVAGVLDFALIGILARLTAVLAEAGVSVFAVSTFDTDYLLVRSDRLTDAVEALRDAGYRVGQS